jgi:hypothetical protein
MRTICPVFFCLLLAAAIAGCGGQDVEKPENPVPPPEAELESTDATVPVPD